MPKAFLLLQSRPEDNASLDEYQSILQISSLPKSKLISQRIDRDLLQNLPNINNYSGIILGGGPSNVSDTDQDKSVEQRQYEPQLYKLLDLMIDRDFPFLGICYGIGLLASYFDKSSVTKNVPEPVGATKIKVTSSAGDDSLLKNVPKEFIGFVGHKEGVEFVPDSIKVLAYSENGTPQMIKVKNNVYATQFHPELDHSGLAKRIQIYKNHGYFHPEESEFLIAESKQHKVEYPQLILKNFIKAYSCPIN